MSKSWLVILVFLPAWLGVPGLAQENRAAISFSDDAVEQAIRAGRKFLWSQYEKDSGHWAEYGDYKGGLTSIVAYALLSAGESPQQHDMRQALEWLARIDMQKTYCLGLRCQVWAVLGERGSEARSQPAMSDWKQRLSRDADKIIKSACHVPSPDGHWDTGNGSYSYECTGKPGSSGDHSNTQYAVLGVWAAAAAGVNLVYGGNPDASIPSAFAAQLAKLDELFDSSTQ